MKTIATILLLLFAFIVFASSSPVTPVTLAREYHNYHGQVHEAVKTLHESTLPQLFSKVKEVVQVLRHIHKNKLYEKRVIHEQRVAANCAEATTNLNDFATNTTCAQQRASILNPSNGQNVGNLIKDYCEGECNTRTPVIINDLVQQCTNRLTWPTRAREVVFNTRFYCNLLDSVRCLTVLEDAVRRFEQNSQVQTFNEEILNSLCAPCVLRIIRLLALRGDISAVTFFKTAVVLRAICTRINGKFCALDLQEAFAEFTKVNTTIGGGGSAPNVDQLRNIIRSVLRVTCRTCTRVLLFRLGALDPQLTFGLGILSSFCRRDGGEFCLIKVFNAVAPLLINPAAATDVCASLEQGTCSPQCKNLLDSFVREGGCCWYILVDLGNSQTVSQQNSAGTNASSSPSTQIFDLCQVSLPPRCSTVARIRYRIVLRGLIKDWVDANLEKLRAAIRSDIQFAVGGADIDSLILTQTPPASRDPRNTDLAVDAQLTSTDQSINPKQINVDLFNTDGTIGAQGRANPTAEIQTEVTAENSSSSLTFSIALLFVLFVISLMF